MVGMGAVIYALLHLWYARENRRREAGAVQEEYRGLAEDELKELGDESPHYRYTI